MLIAKKYISTVAVEAASPDCFSLTPSQNTVISQPATSSQSPAVKSSRSASQGPSTSKKSQMALLTGAVKRKRYVSM